MPATTSLAVPARRPVADPRRLRADRGALTVVRPGRVAYRDAWTVQRRLVAAHEAGTGRDVLLLLEHPPVYTLGRRADPANVVLDPAALATRGIDVVAVDRGGDVTYHGPGQLVGYPVWRLATPHAVVDHVRALEAIMIGVLATYGVTGRRLEGFSGVWVERPGGALEKIGAIGVRVVAGGVTSHGFALNVAPDLTDFGGIVPCGIDDRGVCSLATLGITTDVDEVAARTTTVVAELLDTEVRPGTLDTVLHDAPPVAPLELPLPTGPVRATAPVPEVARS